jgi:hypothetical protein
VRHANEPARRDRSIFNLVVDHEAAAVYGLLQPDG